MENKNIVFRFKRIDLKKVKEKIQSNSVSCGNITPMDLRKDKWGTISFFSNNYEYINSVLKLFEIDKYIMINLTENTHERVDVFFCVSSSTILKMTDNNYKKKLTELNRKLVSFC